MQAALRLPRPLLVLCVNIYLFLIFRAPEAGGILLLLLLLKQCDITQANLKLVSFLCWAPE